MKKDGWVMKKDGGVMNRSSNQQNSTIEVDSIEFLFINKELNEIIIGLIRWRGCWFNWIIIEYCSTSNTVIGDRVLKENKEEEQTEQDWNGRYDTWTTIVEQYWTPVDSNYFLPQSIILWLKKNLSFDYALKCQKNMSANARLEIICKRKESTPVKEKGG